MKHIDLQKPPAPAPLARPCSVTVRRKKDCQSLYSLNLSGDFGMMSDVARAVSDYAASLRQLWEGSGSTLEPYFVRDAACYERLAASIRRAIGEVAP